MESWLSSLIVVVPLSGILDSTQWFRFVGCERLRVHYESPHQSVSPAGVSRVEAEYQPRGVEWRRTLSVPSLNNTTHITFHRTKCSRWALPQSVSWISILHLLLGINRTEKMRYGTGVLSLRTPHCWGFRYVRLGPWRKTTYVYILWLLNLLWLSWLLKFR